MTEIPLLNDTAVCQGNSMVENKSSVSYIPSIGHLFKSHDEAQDAYMEYANRVGFDV